MKLYSSDGKKFVDISFCSYMKAHILGSIVVSMAAYIIGFAIGYFLL